MIIASHTPATPPRRFRFGLRTMFVLVTVVALGCWVANSLNWIRQRREMMDSDKYSIIFGMRGDGHGVFAPGGLWLFGEQGVDVITCYNYHPKNKDIERAVRLFPEAVVRPHQQPPE